MLRLFAKIFLILICAMLLSLGADALYRQAYKLEYKWPQNFWIYPEIPEKYEIVRVGNSHSGNGISFDLFNMKSRDLTTAAQSFEYDLAMLRMYANQIEKGAIVIINVSPISFSQKKPGKAESREYQYYDGRLSPFVIPHLQIGDYLQSQILPFTRSVYLWRETHAKEEKQKAIDAISGNWPKPAEKPKEEAEKEPDVTESGKFAQRQAQTAQEELEQVPFESQDNLAGSVDFIVNKWLHTPDFGKEYFDTNRKDLENLIKYVLDRGWRPVLIMVPISQKLVDGLGQNYMQVYAYDQLEKTNLHGLQFHDFSLYKNLRENAAFFANSDHLNIKGNRILSRLLMELLTEKGYLTK